MERETMGQHGENVDFTGTTTIEWLPEAYHRADGTIIGKWWAEDSRFPGVWADGDTPEAALDHMCVVLQDWWWLKTRDGDDDLPPSNLTLSGRTVEVPE